MLARCGNFIDDSLALYVIETLPPTLARGISAFTVYPVQKNGTRMFVQAMRACAHMHTRLVLTLLTFCGYKQVLYTRAKGLTSVDFKKMAYFATTCDTDATDDSFQRFEDVLEPRCWWTSSK